jgi:Carboxypeptidase regulatory-like domain
MFSALVHAFLVLQLISFGPSTSDATYCRRVEPLSPNLTVSRPTEIRGTIRDQTGAPFANSPVQLRIWVSAEKQASFDETKTDDQGTFRLHEVPPSKYRLLASPNRAFAQPTELTCGKESSCQLDMTLIGNPTDLPASQCPIR